LRCYVEITASFVLIFNVSISYGRSSSGQSCWLKNSEKKLCQLSISRVQVGSQPQEAAPPRRWSATTPAGFTISKVEDIILAQTKVYRTPNP
jgi:hypothetical protein